MRRIEVAVTDAPAMEDLGERLARHVGALRQIWVQGPLGAGKTTLVRGMLRGLGHRGVVRSPTFTLVEPYDLGARRLNHFDLYRLHDPEELEFLGVRDYFQGRDLCVVEWPERARGLLPPPDLAVMIQPDHTGRMVQIVAQTLAGDASLADWR